MEENSLRQLPFAVIAVLFQTAFIFHIAELVGKLKVLFIPIVRALLVATVFFAHGISPPKLVWSS
jgi:hypothetical protein